MNNLLYVQLALLVFAAFSEWIDKKNKKLSTSKLWIKRHLALLLIVGTLILSAIYTIKKKIDEDKQYSALIENDKTVIGQGTTTFEQLLDVQTRAEQLNDSLSELLDKTKQIYQNAKSDSLEKAVYYGKRLNNTYAYISIIGNKIIFSRLPKDSSIAIEYMRNVVEQVYTALSSEFDNPVFRTATKSNAFWSIFANELWKMSMEIDNYNTYTIPRIKNNLSSFLKNFRTDWINNRSSLK